MLLPRSDEARRVNACESTNPTSDVRRRRCVNDQIPGLISLCTPYAHQRKPCIQNLHQPRHMGSSCDALLGVNAGRWHAARSQLPTQSAQHARRASEHEMFPFERSDA